MSAQLAIDQRAAYRGLRPLDPRKDLNQVADLIEEAFTGELEPGGIAALRDLRMLSRMGPLCITGTWLPRSPGFRPAFPV